MMREENAASLTDPLISALPPVPSQSNFSIGSDYNSRVMTGLKTVLTGTTNLLWYFGIVCSLVVIGVYGSFAFRRANTDSLFQEIIYPFSSVLFNVSALFFLKRVKKLSVDFQKRCNDPFYKGIFVLGALLGLMTVAASVEISESSVAGWGPFGNFAVFCFSLNNLITRHLGTVDLGDRAKRRIEFRDIYSILNEFALKKDKMNFDAVSLPQDSSKEEIIKAVVKEMAEIKTPMDLWMASWAKWFFLQMTPAISSIALISMWVSITQSGFNRLDQHWSAGGAFAFLGGHPTTAALVAFPNMAFYALNLFDAANALMDFHGKLVQQFMIQQVETIRQRIVSVLIHTVLVTCFALFTAVAYFSGGGFGATVLGLNQNGYGSVVDNSALSFIVDKMRSFYVEFAQACAGGVNENGTARLMTGFLDHKKKHSNESIFEALFNYMDLKSIYDFFVSVSQRVGSSAATHGHLSSIQRETLEESVISSRTSVSLSPKERAIEAMQEMKNKITTNSFVVKELGDGRKESHRNLLALGENEAIDTTTIISFWKQAKNSSNTASSPSAQFHC